MKRGRGGEARSVLPGVDERDARRSARDRNACEAAEAYRLRRIHHWDEIARRARSMRRGPARAYHEHLERIYRFNVPRGARVLELGCGNGDLLAAVEPSLGVGVDFSGETVRRARARHPELTFVEADAHELPALAQTFDTILLSDLVNDLWDVQGFLLGLGPVTHRRTRVVLNVHSRLWELPLVLAQRLGLAQRTLEQNWLTIEDLRNLLELSGFETIRCWQEVLWPFRVPLLTPLCNRFLARLWGFRHLALANFMVARPAPRPLANEPVVSVVVPARNEAGNIPEILDRVPDMGAGTEIVFVEGHSTDGTWEAIETEIASRPGIDARALRQTGEGKGDAVRFGFEAARGDVLMILDADLTVPPEDLPRFYEAIRSGKGEFVNGVRLVYPMERRAMRFLNLLGNKFFSLAFSWLLGQPIKDTLCGTKALHAADYELLARGRSYFGDFDPFGDFDLLFGAAKLNLDLVEVPIRYRERTYGSTNIQRWRHGWLLLVMCFFAAGRIRFV